MAAIKDLLIPGLPNEIGILCIARVPRANHLKISVVCKSWRNLLNGRFFSDVRRELGLVEEWLFLWSEFGNVWCCYDPSSKTSMKLSPMPRDNRIVRYSGIASIDGKTFVIGGGLLGSERIYGYVPSKTVSYFDARSYRWKRAADLNVARGQCMTGILDNQIYVFGGYTEKYKITNTVEVYNPVTDEWRLISSMTVPTEMKNSVVVGGKFHAITWEEMKGVVYDPQKDSWEDMTDGLRGGWELTTTALNGKLYTLGGDFVVGDSDDEDEDEDEDEHSIEQVIQVYNPSNDSWEIVEEIWAAGQRTFEMEDVEMLSFCGKLCLVCLDTSALRVTIFMVFLEVKESTKCSTCSLTGRDAFDVWFEEKQEKGPENKFCQVIAL